MMRFIFYPAFLLFFGLAPAPAQDQASPAPRRPNWQANRPGMWNLRPGDTLRFLSAEMAYTGVAVKGKPFSAKFSAETTQTLADGNRITHTITARLYRDNEGRTRRDSQLARLGPWTAGSAGAIELSFLQDPVTGIGYTLNPRAKTASKYELKRAPAGLPAQRSFSGKRGGYQRTALGTRVIEGIEALGIRDTWTIPAGRAGNEKPIELSYERWYSQDLQLLIFSRYADPRFGETTYRVTALQREDPAAALFVVPPEYRIVERPSEAPPAK